MTTDNLAGQSAVHGDFKEIAGNNNILVWNFPPGCTDEVQPVDAGYGYQVKVEVGREMWRWLDGVTVKNDDTVCRHIDLWETDAGLDAADRRVLMTIWVARAVNTVNAKRDFIKRCFQRTGAAITLDGTLDEQTRLEGYDQLEQSTGPFRFMHIRDQDVPAPLPVQAGARAGAARYGLDLAYDTCTGTTPVCTYLVCTCTSE